MDSKNADFRLVFMKTGKKLEELKHLTLLNSDSSRMFLSSILNTNYTLTHSDDKVQFLANAWDNLYNQGCITTNEEKKRYLIHLFKFMKDHTHHKHAETKRIIENILKSINLSDQETRNIFRPFFILDEDFFISNQDIMETWMSLYTESSEADLNVVRNVWIEHIKKDLVKIEELEVPEADSYSANGISLILSPIKDKVRVLTINNIEHTTKQKQFSAILKDFLKNNNVLEKLTLFDVGLDWTENDFMENIASGLENATSLKILNMSEIFLKPANVKILASALMKKSTSITTLNISKNSLGKEGLQLLADALKDNTKLISLDISSNSLGADLIKKLLEVLTNLKHVKTLDISSNNFTYKDLIDFATFLKENKSIVELKYRASDLGYFTFKNFLDAFEVNTTLTSIDISSNYFTVQNFRDFAIFLRKNKSIKTLVFAHNDLGLKGSKQFFEALGGNETITSLNIRGNKLKYADYQHLAEALRTNKALKELFIDDYAYGSAELDLLRSAIKERGVTLEVYLDHQKQKSLIVH